MLILSAATGPLVLCSLFGFPFLASLFIFSLVTFLFCSAALGCSPFQPQKRSVDGGEMEGVDAGLKHEVDQYLLPNKREESPYHRLKRDEWSEGAVASLLDAYESKWALRNRAKLKGHDWEDVARHVSSRANCTKGPKTSTQCKNKIESMKKRYRSEVAGSDPISWPLFPRLDLMLRGGGASPGPQLPLLQLDPAPPPPQPPVPPLPSPDKPQNPCELNGVAQEETTATQNEKGNKYEKVAPETDSVTPKCESDDEMLKPKKRIMRMRKKEKGEWEVAESVRWLARVMLRSEQARADAMKEVEKIRAEAEAHKAQMELKRTEIIATTQLQIARLLVGKGEKAGSSFDAGNN